ncbi:unnamed protein product [Ilex paraguariensis]|uniref:Uncharacterized protein n=1 Tax=Ilex paraguariensis TaxID=185542 RepID=A0ABC8U5J5_9AQUA
MALAYSVSQPSLSNPFDVQKIKLTSKFDQREPQRLQIINAEKRCLRCNNLYQDKDNSPTACAFHGHTTGMDFPFSLIHLFARLPICPN